MARTFLSGADLVLPDRVASGQTLVIDGGRVVEIVSGPRSLAAGEVRLDRPGHLVVPGFIDVHVHGAVGLDVLDGRGVVADLASRLPRWGVTAFCPTTVACGPAPLGEFLGEVRELRGGLPRGARVLPAHLESNFINPEYCGAQPLVCLRRPPTTGARAGVVDSPDFTARDVLEVIDRFRPDIAIITMAPELDGGVSLLRAFVAAGVRVSLGHSGATFEEAQAAIAAGARQATHLFNRMRAMDHRDPGLAGAVLASEDVAAELICDGHHVHPAVMNVAIAAKGSSRMMAITDGTAGSGLPAGSRARLGRASITVGDVARLEDGTIAGSVLTMDRAFATLVTQCGLDVVRAAQLCATTPARELGLVGHGVIAAGATADFVLLDSRLNVVETWIGGERAWPEPPAA
jgi:N-acetylglucosamine-6-phosphate deacetylase